MGIKGNRIAAAAKPLNDIILYPVAQKIGLPRTSKALPSPVLVDTTLFGVGIVYRLYANCVVESGSDRCVFYVAYNARAARNEYVVGPGELDFFADNAGLYATAAGNFFGLTGYTQDYQVSSAAVVHQAASGDLVAAVGSLGDAWLQALQDPGWWVLALGSLTAASSAKPLNATAAARITNPQQFPAVARAMRTQANLQGLKVTRSVQLIEQPTVFRHTITGDVPAVNLVRIQQEGSLRFSTGAKAHYGEGVYAWRANASGIGRRYIDIEVPPGTAAELIQTPSGSWYRLVSPEGNTLPVRVVGHNFTDAEVAFGRQVLAP